MGRDIVVLGVHCDKERSLNLFARAAAASGPYLLIGEGSKAYIWRKIIRHCWQPLKVYLGSRAILLAQNVRIAAFPPLDYRPGTLRHINSDQGRHHN